MQLGKELSDDLSAAHQGGAGGPEAAQADQMDTGKLSDREYDILKTSVTISVNQFQDSYVDLNTELKSKIPFFSKLTGTQLVDLCECGNNKTFGGMVFWNGCQTNEPHKYPRWDHEIVYSLNASLSQLTGDQLFSLCERHTFFLSHILRTFHRSGQRFDYALRSIVSPLEQMSGEQIYKLCLSEAMLLVQLVAFLYDDLALTALDVIIPKLEALEEGEQNIIFNDLIEKFYDENLINCNNEPDALEKILSRVGVDLFSPYLERLLANSDWSWENAQFICISVVYLSACPPPRCHCPVIERKLYDFFRDSRCPSSRKIKEMARNSEINFHSDHVIDTFGQHKKLFISKLEVFYLDEGGNYLISDLSRYFGTLYGSYNHQVPMDLAMRLIKEVQAGKCDIAKIEPIFVMIYDMLSQYKKEIEIDACSYDPTIQYTTPAAYLLYHWAEYVLNSEDQDHVRVGLAVNTFLDSYREYIKHPESLHKSITRGPHGITIKSEEMPEIQRERLCFILHKCIQFASIKNDGSGAIKSCVELCVKKLLPEKLDESPIKNSSFNYARLLEFVRSTYEEVIVSQDDSQQGLSAQNSVYPESFFQQPCGGVSQGDAGLQSDDPQPQPAKRLCRKLD